MTEAAEAARPLPRAAALDLEAGGGWWSRNSTAATSGWTSLP